jgi:hypothetical protein
MKDEPAEAKNDELLHWFNGKDVIWKMNQLKPKNDELLHPFNGEDVV